MKMSKEMRLMKAEIDRTNALEIGASQSNDKWEWIDIEITDIDPTGASETVANLVKEYDFDLCGVDFEEKSIRVNRKQ